MELYSPQKGAELFCFVKVWGIFREEKLELLIQLNVIFQIQL